MKTVMFSILLCLSAHGADIHTTNVVGDITTRISERTGKDAQFVRRVETSYRGKALILRTLMMAAPQSISHGYSAGGELLMEENDDGNGIFEDFTVYFPGTPDLEIFTRKADGTVIPASTRRIELVKQRIAVTGELIQKPFQNKNPSEDDLGKLFDRAQEKMRKLKQEELQATNVANDITTKVTERKGKDGNPDLRDETSYRGTNRILEVVSQRNKQGKMVVVFRGYCVDGKPIVDESDQDGDAEFNVYSPDKNAFEIFTRHADGTVTPASTAQIELIRKESDIEREELRKGIEHPEMSDEEISKLLQQTRQKIQNLNNAGSNR